MPAKRFTTTVPIAGTVENALSGLSFEFPDSNVNVTLAATSPSGDDADMEVQFGSELVMERSAVAIENAAGVGPILPDNVVLSTPSIAGRRLSVRLFNNDGAATSDVTLLIETTPI